MRNLLKIKDNELFYLLTPTFWQDFCICIKQLWRNDYNGTQGPIGSLIHNTLPKNLFTTLYRNQFLSKYLFSDVFIHTLTLYNKSYFFLTLTDIWTCKLCLKLNLLHSVPRIVVLVKRMRNCTLTCSCMRIPVITPAQAWAHAAFFTFVP